MEETLSIRSIAKLRAPTLSDNKEEEFYPYQWLRKGKKER